MIQGSTEGHLQKKKKEDFSRLIGFMVTSGLLYLDFSLVEQIMLLRIIGMLSWPEGKENNPNCAAREVTTMLLVSPILPPMVSDEKLQILKEIIAQKKALIGVDSMNLRIFPSEIGVFLCPLLVRLLLGVS